MKLKIGHLKANQCYCRYLMTFEFIWNIWNFIFFRCHPATRSNWTRQFGPVSWCSSPRFSTTTGSLSNWSGCIDGDFFFFFFNFSVSMNPERFYFFRVSLRVVCIHLFKYLHFYVLQKFSWTLSELYSIIWGVRTNKNLQIWYFQTPDCIPQIGFYGPEAIIVVSSASANWRSDVPSIHLHKGTPVPTVRHFRYGREILQFRSFVINKERC